MHPVSLEEIEHLARNCGFAVEKVQHAADQQGRVDVSWTSVALRLTCRTNMVLIERPQIMTFEQSEKPGLKRKLALPCRVKRALCCRRHSGRPSGSWPPPYRRRC
jgi:hypothetical protein